MSSKEFFCPFLLSCYQFTCHASNRSARSKTLLLSLAIFCCMFLNSKMTMCSESKFYVVQKSNSVFGGNSKDLISRLRGGARSNSTVADPVQSTTNLASQRSTESKKRPRTEIQNLSSKHSTIDTPIGSTVPIAKKEAGGETYFEVTVPTEFTQKRTRRPQI